MQTKFNLAWGSVKSESKVEVGEGVALLMGTGGNSVSTLWKGSP